LGKAEKKKGFASPNPVVAAAVIKDGEMISMGIHEKAGTPHAEVAAIRPVLDQCLGATLLVTLEPCTHFGKTPPCTELIIKAGISKVVYAVDDPNPKVRYQAAKQILSAHGIEVISGIEALRAKRLNDAFFKSVTDQKPLVILKAGLTLDGRIATSSGKSKYITGPKSLVQVHKLRRECDAILIGVGAILADDPQLNIRHKVSKISDKSQKIIIVDPTLKTSQDAKLFSLHLPKDLIFVTRQSRQSNQGRFEGVTWLDAYDNNGKLDWPNLLAQLHHLGVQSLLLEGGAGIYTTAIEADCVDRVALFFATKFMMSGLSVLNSPKDYPLNDLPHLRDFSLKKLGQDFWLSGYIKD